LLHTVAIFLTSDLRAFPAETKRRLAPRKTRQNAIGPSFVQILAKLDFLKLSENFPRILVDYAQNRLHRANADFSAAC